jgi:hypothetical protein
MTTLMTLWLATGLQVQLYTSERMCAYAVEAIARSGMVIVTMPNGAPVEAVDAMCETGVGDLEINGEPA